MKKKNSIEKLIEEDLVNYQGSKAGGQGYDWHNYKRPQQTNLVDILKVDKGDMDQAKKTMPHQLQTTFDKILYLSEQVDGLKDDLVKAYNNPIIKDDKRKRELIKEMVNDLNEANDKYREVVKKLDQLQL
jgi:hypothetical protein